MLEILDEHFARIEILLNGYNFSELNSISDFRIFKPKKNKPVSDKQRKQNTKKNFEMAIKLKALQEQIKAKRNEIRKQRKA
jgi:hypothetical protein